MASPRNRRHIIVPGDPSVEKYARHPQRSSPHPPPSRRPPCRSETATSSAPKACNAASTPPRGAERPERVGAAPDVAQPKCVHQTDKAPGP